MIHDPTAGFFDRAGMVTKPLDMRIVRRLLVELAEIDGAGAPKLGGWKGRFEDGCVILPAWLRHLPSGCTNDGLHAGLTANTGEWSMCGSWWGDGHS
jgi:hypothetical protein